MPFLIGDLGWYINLSVLHIGIIMIIFFISLSIILTFFLKVTLSLITANKIDFQNVFITSIFITLLFSFFIFGGSLFLIIASFISSVIIYKRHETKYGWAVVVTIFGVVIGLIITIFIVIIISWLIGIPLIGI
ncbi:MAG: hypothetical protein ACTSQJ_19345 [Promethearchaeota archaeon]